MVEHLYGIDYGAKLAGTTVVAWLSGRTLQFSASAKKQNADRFLLDFFSDRPPGKIFIDAPLSLPKVYRRGSNDSPPASSFATEEDLPDFHYRACDRALGAMSPMFLGGLTARAMKLAFQLRRDGHTVQETYPGMLARHLELTTSGYKGDKKEIERCLNIAINTFDVTCPAELLLNWHHFDALLALSSALRHERREATIVGDEEGLIVF